MKVWNSGKKIIDFILALLAYQTSEHHSKWPEEQQESSAQNCEAQQQPTKYFPLLLSDRAVILY